jgi:hypothetical protein
MKSVIKDTIDKERYADYKKYQPVLWTIESNKIAYGPGMLSHAFILVI